MPTITTLVETSERNFIPTVLAAAAPVAPVAAPTPVAAPVQRAPVKPITEKTIPPGIVNNANQKNAKKTLFDSLTGCPTILLSM